MIKYGGGYPAFCHRYGDYYLAGYRIGGETGILISTSSFPSKKVETFEIKVTLEVLIFQDLDQELSRIQLEQIA